MNKKVIIIISVVILVLLGGGGYYILSSNKQTAKPASQTQPVDAEEVLEPISPADLGLKLSLRNDKKAIKFVIENAKDIENIDYQISYTKDVKGEKVPEGLIGEAKPENGIVEIKYREFGTCSSGTCRYDNVVSPIKVTLKIQKSNGKMYKSEDSIEL